MIQENEWLWVREFGRARGTGCNLWKGDQGRPHYEDAILNKDLKEVREGTMWICGELHSSQREQPCKSLETRAGLVCLKSEGSWCLGTEEGQEWRLCKALWATMWATRGGPGGIWGEVLCSGTYFPGITLAPVWRMDCSGEQGRDQWLNEQIRTWLP